MQIWADWKYYFTSIPNLLDFVGLICILSFFLSRSNDGSTVFILIFGLFCKIYRAIMSLSIIYEKFMISIQLIKNSIFDMIPFLFILGT